MVGHEAQPRRQKIEDVGGLRHDGITDLHERRRERQRTRLLAPEEPHHRRHAALGSRDVDIVGAGFLEQEADELAAALDRRPVVELDAHRQVSART